MAKGEMSLDVQAVNYWTGRQKNGAGGLVLLDKCIQRTALHRDWDALARFVSNAIKYGQGQKVTKIIRAAFGDKLIWKANSKLETGGTFVLGFEGAFPLDQSNTYTLVTAAIARGAAWDDSTFQKELPSPDKKAREVSEVAKEKAVKHVLAYLDKLKADGFPIGEILASVQKGIVAKGPQHKVEMQNGVQVTTLVA